jgi:hypothetical protein
MNATGALPSGYVRLAHHRRTVNIGTFQQRSVSKLDQLQLTRRRALALGATGVAALAGCLSTSDSDDTGDTQNPDNGTVSQDGGVATDPADGLDLPVDDSEFQRGAAKDAIPAIVDPVFDDDWSGLSIEVQTQFGERQTIEPRLQDDDPVIGVAREGEARAYPFRILNWHEIVNDEFGEPLLVTYCPLCRSAVTAERRVDGEATVFGVSGLLYRNALVMYDEATESRWSQLAARAIQGPMTGETLDLEQATITSWGDWQATRPETVVLVPPPESGTVSSGDGTRNYTVNPYAGYDETGNIGLGGEFDDDRLHAKTEVVGIANDGVARAYDAPTLAEEGIVEDTVGGLPVVVTTTADGTPVAWVREVDGEVLSFTGADESHLEAGGSRWTRTTGRAVDGPHEGTQLAQANAVSSLFWFAWLDIHSDTELYGHEE